MEVDLIDPKADLRAAAQKRRAGISEAEAIAAAARVADRVIATLGAMEPTLLRSVALYSSMRGEMPTRALAVLLADAALSYPRIEGEHIVFRRVAGPDELGPGYAGILEPPADAPSILPRSLDTIIVPGLAFDRAGARLGWGRGYYDRALREHTGALRVAIAFDCQIIDDVPTNELDAPVDLIITEEQAIVCPGADRDRS